MKSLKTTDLITKKYAYEIMSCDCIKDSYKDILPSNNILFNQHKKYSYSLFKDMIKEGIKKKEEYGMERIEEILIVAEIINKKKDIINIEGSIISFVNDFIKIAKEKGFEIILDMNNNNMFAEYIYSKWMEV